MKTQYETKSFKQDTEGRSLSTHFQTGVGFFTSIEVCCPRSVMVKVMDCGNRSKRVRTPVALLCSLSD